MPSSRSPFARYALGVLGLNLAVIVWGAFVRASKSGDGCGAHWPVCNGEVIPTAPTFKTLVEYSHRLTSGLALVSVVVLAVWAFRAFDKGHAVRRAAGASMLFMLLEAAVGAMLVLFKYVAGNDTLGRAMFMAVHLVNTFLLVGALTLTALWALRPPGRLSRDPRIRTVGVVLLGSVMLLGVSGAIAALGDTLFPAVSLLDGLQSDFAPTAHLFVRLRMWHPVLAVASSALALAAAAWFAKLRRGHEAVQRTSSLVGTLVVGQLGLGALNVALLAPVWIQLVHLLVADLVWMSLVVLCAVTLDERRPDARA
jgi:cytochrome c oxidase assembly protein subunit 15